MLTPENFKTYVGFQECTGSHAIVFMLGITREAYDSWVDNIRTMSTDQVLDQLLNQDTQTPKVSLSINKYVVDCNMSLEQVLVTANNLILTFPKTHRPEAYARSRVAFHSRRGAANQKLGDDIVLYRGSTEIDCCAVIAKVKDKYGIVAQPNFQSYGMIFNDGSKV